MRNIPLFLALSSVVFCTSVFAFADAQCDAINATWHGTQRQPEFLTNGTFLGVCYINVTVQAEEENGVVIFNGQQNSLQGCTFKANVNMTSFSYSGSCNNGALSLQPDDMNGGIIGNQMVVNGDVQGQAAGLNLNK